MILKFKDEAIYKDSEGQYQHCVPSQKPEDWTEDSQLKFYNENCRGMYCQAHIVSDIDIFILPIKDFAQGQSEEAAYQDDVIVFNKIDLGQIDMTGLQLQYSPEHFFSESLWEFIVDNTLIDETATNKVTNSIYAKYATKNEEVYIKDFTIDELKNFRTWLATTLYNDYNEDDGRLDQINKEETDMMLKYYSNNMYDDVIKALTKLGQNSVLMKDFLKAYGVFSPNTVVSNIGGTGVDIMTKSTGNMVNVVTGKTVMALPGSTSRCGCSGSLNMYDMGLSACDCVEIYRKNVYAQMVADFSNIDFWKNRSEILPDFMKYIEGIIKNNFTLGYSEHSTLYCDCSCNSANDQQSANMTILRNLLKALQYIYNEVEGEGEGLSGHKNFVSESLNKWAVILYEKMQWI